MSCIRLICAVVLVLSVVLFLGIRALGWFFSMHDRPLDEVRTVKTQIVPQQWVVGYEKGPVEARMTILYVHGTPGDASAFREQMNGEFPGMRLVAIDRPGFGASEGGRHEACLAVQAQMLNRFIDGQGYPRVILVGHSYGAPVAVAAALTNPRVAGVVLMGGCFNPEYEKPWPIQYVGDWSIISWVLPRELRQCNVELLRLKDDLIELDQHLSQLNCPILMLHGDQDDLVPVGNVAYVQKRMAELHKESLFSCKIYPGWNHFIPWQHAEEVNGEMRKFVNKLSGGAGVSYFR